MKTLRTMSETDCSGKSTTSIQLCLQDLNDVIRQESGNGYAGSGILYWDQSGIKINYENDAVMRASEIQDLKRKVDNLIGDGDVILLAVRTARALMSVDHVSDEQILEEYRRQAETLKVAERLDPPKA